MTDIDPAEFETETFPRTNGPAKAATQITGSSEYPGRFTKR